jgi:hypothetical protein
MAQLKNIPNRRSEPSGGSLGTWCYLRTADLATAEELPRMVESYTTHTESLEYPKVGWLSTVPPTRLARARRSRGGSW